MKIIRLSGYVGFEITSAYVADALASANGDDIEVHLNTQGGQVYEGVAIYDLFANYSGGKTLIMGGLVASIGSYIATAFDKVIAQDISIYMIHNVSTCVCGDYLELRKEADELEKLNGHVGDRLARFSKKSNEDILGLMAAESWYYGKEIIDGGFATEYRETGKGNLGTNDVDVAKLKYHNGMKQVAAFLGEPPKKPKEEKIMTLQEIIDAMAPFIANGEFKFDQAVALFKAEDKLITAEQTEKLNALGEHDVADLIARAEAADKLVQDTAMDEAFGKEGLLRDFANTSIKAGLTIDEIKTNPVALALAAKNAAGEDEPGIVDHKDDKVPAKGPKRYKY